MAEIIDDAAVDAVLASPRGGRPSKFSRTLADRLLVAIRLGEFIPAACLIAGISRVTLHNWLKQGVEAERQAQAKWFSLSEAKRKGYEKIAHEERYAREMEARAAKRPIDVLDPTTPTEEQPYALLSPKLAELGRFLYAYGVSMHECDLRMLSAIHAATPKDWRAARYILQQRHPLTWGRKRLELSGPDGGPIAVRPVGIYLPANGRPDVDPPKGGGQ